MSQQGWTPYGDGTSGHQGAASEDAEPSRRRIIDIVLEELRAAGRRGMTWREVADTFGTHHGSASGALSNLHRSGAAVRLAEKRDGAGVYVTPENLEGRAWLPHRSNRRPTVTRNEIIDRLFTMRECPDSIEQGRACRYCEGVEVYELLREKGIVQ